MPTVSGDIQQFHVDMDNFEEKSVTIDYNPVVYSAECHCHGEDPPLVYTVKNENDWVSNSANVNEPVLYIDKT